MLGADGAEPAPVGVAFGSDDRQDEHESEAERRARQKQLLRPDHAIGWNVGRPPAPGARLALHRVVDRDGDVVGVRTGEPGVGHQVEERARSFGSRGLIARGGVACNPGSDRGQRRRHPVELAADERLDPRGGGGVARAKPPAFDGESGQSGQGRRQEANAEQSAPAHALLRGPAARKGQSHSSSRIPQR